MLSVDGVVSGYGRIEALHGVSLEVRQGEVVSLVGGNGAGKTTLLRAISGVQPVRKGAIRFHGKPLDGIAAHARVKLGIAQVPEGRQVFTPLTVEDNLRLGAWTRHGPDTEADIDMVYGLFPVLGEKRALQAGALSGGQQQMLAIGRALMSKPRLVLLDEPSMGLAPILVDQVFAVIASLRERGLTVLLVEQNAYAALSIADRGYVIETGHVTMEGRGADLLADARIREAYLGM
jgi:branched-chain amino acid transport system ATP-binding protein